MYRGACLNVRSSEPSKKSVKLVVSRSGAPRRPRNKHRTHRKKRRKLRAKATAFPLLNLAPGHYEDGGSGVRFSFCWFSSFSKGSSFVRTFLRSARTMAMSARDGLIMRNPWSASSSATSPGEAH